VLQEQRRLQGRLARLEAMVDGVANE
jgi:hypothetical protein